MMPMEPMSVHVVTAHLQSVVLVSVIFVSVIFVSVIFVAVIFVSVVLVSVILLAVDEFVTLCHSHFYAVSSTLFFYSVYFDSSIHPLCRKPRSSVCATSIKQTSVWHVGLQSGSTIRSPHPG